ncbi:MAG: recombinase family protein [Actinobacteria bacterium]|nr:recombinase family protein [Actinomycetota bacterium]
MSIPKHPALYVRISDDREGESKGVARQLKDGFALAEARGWPEPAVYNDNDKSAWKKTVVRDDFRRLLADIKDGLIDALIVYDSDRFYRQPRELEEFLDICEGAKLTQLTQVTGDVDLASTDGKLTLRIKAAVAVKESDDKSRRIKRKHLELAEAGERNGGGRGFGYEDDGKTIRQAEAEVLLELKDRIFAGESIRSLCFDLNERGIKTATGGEWSQFPLRRLMMSAGISGRREHNGEIVAVGKWPAIIATEDSDRLRAMLKDPARRKNQMARRYLLTGMLRCGRCGAPLVARPRQDKRRRYVCARQPGSEACGKLAILSDELEEMVVEMVLHRLDGEALPRALAAQHDDRGDDHQQEVDAAAAQLEELAGLYAAQSISAAEWMAARGPIEERLERAKRKLADVDGTTAIHAYLGGGQDLRERWKELSMDRQRAVLGALIDHITIGPALVGRNFFDPDRVAPTWRV